MEYIIEMHTVVETPTYLKAAETLFSAEEREEIVAMIASDPECGDVMTGTGDSGRFASDVTAWANVAGRELSTSSATVDFRFSW